MKTISDFFTVLSNSSTTDRRSIILDALEHPDRYPVINYVGWEAIVSKALCLNDDLDTLIAMATHRQDYYGFNGGDTTGSAARIHARNALDRANEESVQIYIAERVYRVDFMLATAASVARVRNAVTCVYELRGYVSRLDHKLRMAKPDEYDNPCHYCPAIEDPNPCTSCQHTSSNFLVDPIVEAYSCLAYTKMLLELTDFCIPTYKHVLRDVDAHFAKFGHPLNPATPVQQAVILETEMTPAIMNELQNAINDIF